LISELQIQIQKDVAAHDPAVEVLLAEVLGATTLRVFIDHPEGVTLALCEQVTAALVSWRERYALEVSSPGRERPLTRPADFRRFVGHRARVRTHGHVSDAPGRSTAQRRGAQPAPRGESFTGELLSASDDEVTLAVADGVVAIPYAEIRRSNLVEA
jgi:ribosome maturation factor RimP